ncbi:MAG: nitrite reductase (NAD(P)H) small subunit [Candidatus Kapabacteria bacterium]|jgi:NAD(P)H-dependent nitrite reductase small subunit|nr:nitrite reductase (NAD(P)H) small subunit [Candidatus Kapabacteria bacterium]
MDIYPNDDFPTVSRNNKTFVQVCASKDVLRRKGTRVEFDEELQIAIFRIGDRLHAVSNICPHNHSPLLHEGEINAEDCTISCPLHGYEFSLTTGKHTSSNLSHVEVYEVFEEDDAVFLEKPEPKELDWKW